MTASILRPTAAILLVLAACTRPAREEQTGDTRRALPLPPEARDAVRTEMRTMLGSINRILVALARWDTAGIREAAAASGLATAADPTLEKLLPEQFMTWGVETHSGFDTLVTVAAAPDTVLARLGGITQKCVTCHATYRIVSQ